MIDVVRRAIPGIVAQLQKLGYVVPSDLVQAANAIKSDRRDNREPGALEKERAEIRLARIMRRIFRSQRERVRHWLEMWYPGRKAIDDLPDLDPDVDVLADLISEIVRDTHGGINLFAAMTNIPIDYTLTNSEAAKKAREYTYELVKSIDDKTKEALQNAISAFVETPGMTIGDAMALLPFDEERARMVAVTEVTRAYADGQQMAGEEMAKEFPGVRVVKEWFTNNDDRVCEICGPLGDLEPVDIDEPFDDDIFNPPAHPRCRCWTRTRTVIK